MISCVFQLRSRAKCLLLAGSGMVVLLTLAGCANPGLPKAPSLHLPEKAASLRAERVGDEVRLSWTLPPKTTDGELIKGAVTASVCRRVMVPRAGGCLPIGSARMVPGPGSRVDVLPVTLATGPALLLEYHVELANAAGRSAGASEPFFAVGGAAPPAAGSVVVEPTREGMMVRWPVAAPTAAAQATMQVTRTWLNPPPPKAGSGTAAQGTPVFGKRADRNEVVMVAEQASPHQADVGGMLDRSAIDGGRYTYVAQRVQMVDLGGHKLEMRGAPSPAVTATWAAIFPPPVVTGLVSIPGGGFGAAPSIDLSWEPEDDVLGYNVYRAVDGGTPARVNAAAVTSPGYRDLQVAGGHRYSYTVTAMGRHQTESAPSAPVVETLRP